MIKNISVIYFTALIRKNGYRSSPIHQKLKVRFVSRIWVHLFIVDVICAIIYVIDKCAHMRETERRFLSFFILSLFHQLKYVNSFDDLKGNDFDLKDKRVSQPKKLGKDAKLQACWIKI